MYDKLQAKGYKYATLAKGVVLKDSFSGSAANNFLLLTAKASGKTLTSSDLKSIYKGMAQGYLSVLGAQFEAKGWVTNDINHKEAWAFHKNVFEGHGLTVDAWTLNSVFILMGNDPLRDRYWEELLDTAGDFSSELLLAIQTERLMNNMSAFGNAPVKKVADSWTDRVMTPSTMVAAAAGATGLNNTRMGKLFDDISSSVLEGKSTTLSTNAPVRPVAPPVAPPRKTPSPPAPPKIPPPPLPPVKPPVPPKPPVSKQPAKKRRRTLPRPTTHRGFPDSGFHGGAPSGGGGSRLRIDP